MSHDEKPVGPADSIALTIIQDGRTRHVTLRELSVGNKLAGDALLSLLVEKGIVTAEEFQDKIRHLQEQHYRPGNPAGADSEDG